MPNQSSIEWLVEQMLKQGYFDGDKPFTFTNLDHLQHEAKEMHKEEIENAYCEGAWDMAHNDQIWPRQKAEQYYQETYGGNNE